MAALLKGVLAPLSRWSLLPRGIHSKPPKGKVGPAETIIGFSVLAMGVLSPAGWVLSHLSDYRKK